MSSVPISLKNDVTGAVISMHLAVELAMERRATVKDPKESYYATLSEADRKLNVEGRLTDVLSTYGGKRLVAGKVVHDLVHDLAQEIYKMKADGLI